MNQSSDELSDVWAEGYSIAELWGFTKPVSRGGAASAETHLILWGILGIVEYQVDRGAGHKYLRERLRAGDWTAIGYREPSTPSSRLEKLPLIKDAQFGRKVSAVGDGVTIYTNVRIVHARLIAELTAGQAEPAQN